MAAANTEAQTYKKIVLNWSSCWLVDWLIDLCDGPCVIKNTVADSNRDHA